MIQYNGKTYRKVEKAVSIKNDRHHLCPANFGKYEILYKGKWLPVKNYNIRCQLDDLIGKE